MVPDQTIVNTEPDVVNSFKVELKDLTIIKSDESNKENEKTADIK